MYHALIFTAATSTRAHLPLQTSAIITFSHWDLFSGDSDSILRCLLLRLTHCLPPQHTWTRHHFWLTAEQWIGLQWISFFAGNEAGLLWFSTAAVARYVLQCRSETKTKSQKVGVLRPRTFPPLCVWITFMGRGRKGSVWMWHISCLTTEEATTIKFNKVLVTDEAWWQCAGPLPFSPRPKQPVWCNVNPFTSREKLHKHMGHLQGTEIYPFSSCPLTPNTFIVFKRKCLFPIDQKLKAYLIVSLQVCDWENIWCLVFCMRLCHVSSPTYLPPGLMTMALLLRVSSSTWAMFSLAFW